MAQKNEQAGLNDSGLNDEKTGFVFGRAGPKRGRPAVLRSGFSFIRFFYVIY